MLFDLLVRRRGNAEIVDRLYAAVATIARDPWFYAELGVPDSFEGRFDMLTLAAALALSRLQALPSPGHDLASDLADAIFREFDGALRETGVGDIVVPKRMKTMAGAFFGRAQAYAAALAGGSETLDAAILRNIFNGRSDRVDAARALAEWALASQASLAAAGIEAFVEGRPPFARPRAIRAGDPQWLG